VSGNALGEGYRCVIPVGVAVSCRTPDYSSVVRSPALGTPQNRRFQIHPSWAPSWTAHADFVQMPRSEEDFCQFDRERIYAAKVLNTSRVGSQRLRNCWQL